jgi:mRNA interferase RelE/StbE
VSPAQRHEVLWTQTALEMLAGIGDRRIQQQLFDTSKRLETDPDKQGKPLRESLLGFRSLRVVGQRYRLVYSVDSIHRLVHVVATGLRREGSRDDVYELAQKIVRLGLAPPTRQRKAVK